MTYEPPSLHALAPGGAGASGGKAPRETEDLDFLFTPDVLAAVARGAEEARDGKSMSREDVTAYLAQEQSRWLAHPPR